MGACPARTQPTCLSHRTLSSCLRVHSPSTTAHWMGMSALFDRREDLLQRSCADISVHTHDATIARHDLDVTCRCLSSRQPQLRECRFAGWSLRLKLGCSLQLLSPQIQQRRSYSRLRRKFSCRLTAVLPALDDVRALALRAALSLLRHALGLAAFASTRTEAGGRGLTLFRYERSRGRSTSRSFSTSSSTIFCPS